MSTKRSSKVSKASNKAQGTKASTGSLSDDRRMKSPEQLERGEGSEFANAVKSAIADSKNLKGSANSFLGVDKKIIDPKQFAHSLVDSTEDK